MQTILYIIIAGIIALAIAIFHYYYKSKNSKKVSYILTFLRFVSVFCLLLLLINPKIERQEIETIKPNLVVAVDNSSSIEYFEESDNVTDLISELKSNPELNDKFKIDYFSFGDAIQLSDSLSFDESQTNISKPFQQFKELYKNEIAPIILITDGNQTYGQDYEYLNILQPVFPIVVGDTTKYADVFISQLNVNKYAYLDNKFPVEVFLNYDGEKPISSNFSIFKGNQKVYSKNLNFSTANNSHNLSFHLPTDNVGVHYYSASIEQLDNEKNTVNNTKNFVVEVIDEQAKILLLTSFIHPDVGTLKKSIESNKQRIVEVKVIGEEFELLDYQSVILYQPTAAFLEVFTAIDLENVNHFIITGSKTAWNFLNRVQRNFTKNVINQTENYSAVFNPSFGTFVTDAIGFDDFPPLLDKFGDITFNIPYESLLYQQVGSYITEKPLLATYENQDRRSVVLFGENSWRWRMASKLKSQEFNDFDNFIGKVMQYLASSKQVKRLSVESESFYYANDEIRIRANYMDKNYVFDAGATLWLSVKNRISNEAKRYPFSLQGNSYSVGISGLLAGDYNYTVSVENQNVSVNGSFKILNFDVEQQFTNANVSKLSSISKKTNGTIYYLDDTFELAADLINDKRFTAIQKSEKKLNSIIDWKWLLAVIMLSLSLEWFIRKYKGLI